MRAVPRAPVGARSRRARAVPDVLVRRSTPGEVSDSSGTGTYWGVGSLRRQQGVPARGFDRCVPRSAVLPRAGCLPAAPGSGPPRGAETSVRVERTRSEDSLRARPSHQALPPGVQTNRPHGPRRGGPADVAPRSPGRLPGPGIQDLLHMPVPVLARGPRRPTGWGTAAGRSFPRQRAPADRTSFGGLADDARPPRPRQCRHPERLRRAGRGGRSLRGRKDWRPGVADNELAVPLRQPPGVTSAGRSRHSIAWRCVRSSLSHAAPA